MNYDDWKTYDASLDDASGEETCRTCGGSGEVARAHRVYFDEVRGFDAEDEHVECLACDGTGRPL